MKKVLFATTALVASAGIAAADVKISGSAEMGVAGGTNMDLQFIQSVDVRFAMTGQTDGGLTFGATIDLEDAVDTAVGGIDTVDVTNGQFADFTVFVSGAFGTLTMGDTDGAYDWALTEVALAGGSLTDNETGHGGYNGNSGLDGTYDGQIVRYDYSFGNFAFAVSAEMDDIGAGDAVLGVGVKYSAPMGATTIGVGVGYQTANNVDIIGASLMAGFDNGFKAALNWSELNGTANDYTHIGVGIAYVQGPWTFAANYGNYDRVNVGTDSSGFGAVINYNLGGGAVIQAGYGNTSPEVGNSTDTYSFGLSMSF